MNFTKERLVIIKKTLTKKETSYGNPLTMLTEIAKQWTKYQVRVHNATDVAFMMARLKQCRIDYLVSVLEKELDGFKIENGGRLAYNGAFRTYRLSLQDLEEEYVEYRFIGICPSLDTYQQMKNLLDSLLDRDCYLYLAHQFKEETP